MLHPTPYRCLIRYDLNSAAVERLTRVLLVICMMLVLLSTIGQISNHYWGHDTLKGFVPLFYLDGEANVPTWFSSAILLIAAALASMIALQRQRIADPYRWHWHGLSILLLLLSMDEVAMVHEEPIEPLRNYLQCGGLLYYAWVIAGVLCALLVGGIYAKFLLRLPQSVRNLFLMAGALYVGGAIGLEMISGLLADVHGEQHFGYSLVITLEELCEMLGIIVFIYATGSLLTVRKPQVRAGWAF